jgi:chromosome segregation ATPase
MSNEDGYYVQECKHLRAKLINLSCDLAETTKSLEAAQDQRDRFAAEVERLQELAVSTSKEGTSFYYKEAFESGQTELRELRAEVGAKDKRIAELEAGLREIRQFVKPYLDSAGATLIHGVVVRLLKGEATPEVES